MNNFPASITAFGCYLIIITIMLISPPRSSKLGYFAELKEKEHLLSTEHSPKIIFIGGSNLAYGLDSKYLETKFHMPVVNMGLCSLFGLRFILEELTNHVNAGDLIVFVPEYGLLQDPVLVDGCADLLHAIEVEPKTILIICQAYLRSPSGLIKMLNLLQHIIVAKWHTYQSVAQRFYQGRYNYNESQRKEALGPNGLAIKYCFDKHGDYLGHLGSKNEPSLGPTDLLSNLNSDAILVVNRVADSIVRKRAKFVIIPCPMPFSYSKMANENQIKHWSCSKLTVPVLASISRYVMPDYYFYEQPYHLNATGRTLRTELVADDITHYLDKSSFASNTKAFLR